MNIHKVKQKLEAFPLEELAHQTRFIKTNNYKITPLAYALSFIEMVLTGVNTLEVWASRIARMTGNLISVQGLQNRIQYPQVDFCRKLLELTISQQVNWGTDQLKTNELLDRFENVYLEDSTCVTLPESSFDFFPGTVNQQGQSSSARIQLLMELKTGAYKHIELQSYRDNDQKHAPQIINRVKAGDLVIRDLGYFIIGVFKELDSKGVHFLSRLNSTANIYDEQSGEQIQLAKLLRSLRKKGIQQWDHKVLLGSEQKLPVRVIAIKAPPHVEQQRKRKANRDRRSKRSSDYMELLGWTILITNVPPEVWKPYDALKIYGFRWRIEIVFKCWKRHFNCHKIFKNKNSLSHPRILINFYLMLIATTLLFTSLYMLTLIRVFKQTGKVLSFQKFGNYLREKQFNFNPQEMDETEVEIIGRYYCQTTRKEKSFFSELYIC